MLKYNCIYGYNVSQWTSLDTMRPNCAIFQADILGLIMWVSTCRLGFIALTFSEEPESLSQFNKRSSNMTTSMIYAWIIVYYTLKISLRSIVTTNNHHWRTPQKTAYLEWQMELFATCRKLRNLKNSVERTMYQYGCW